MRLRLSMALSLRSLMVANWLRLGVIGLWAIAAVLATVAMSATDGGVITHSVEFNPGAVVAQNCETVVMRAYTNETSATAHLVAVDLWAGIVKGAYADVTVKLLRESDGSTIALLAQDRYAEPNGIHQRYVSFSPYSWVLAAGDRVILHGLNCHVAGVESPMHPIVVMYFE